MYYEKRIALFGGSFNPIHKGHLGLVSYILDKNLSDEVWLVPSNYHAFKGEIKEASLVNRLEMLETVLDNQIKLEKYEVEKKQVTYTIDTLRYVIKGYPNFCFQLLVGADNIKKMHLWHDYHLLFQYSHVYFFNRLGGTDNYSGGLPKKLEKYSEKITFVRDFNFNISSSEIRERVKRKKKIVNLLPKSVYQYIKLHRLYE